jgi:uncharacterized protein
MLDQILVAFALVLIIEGLMPLFVPSVWREMFGRILAMRDGQLRFVGLGSVLAGVVLLMVAT